jgi:hypothetical protein
MSCLDLKLRNSPIEKFLVRIKDEILPLRFPFADPSHKLRA